MLIQNQLIHEVVDIDEDRDQGVRTTALVLGSMKTWVAVVALGLLAVAMIVLIGIDAENLGVYLLEALPIAVSSVWLPAAYRGGRDPASLRRFQRGVGLLSGAAVWATFYMWPFLSLGGGGA